MTQHTTTGSNDPVTGVMADLVRRAVRDGIGPVTPSRPWAQDVLERVGGDVGAAVDRLVQQSTVAAASTGFLTGVGGLLTLPVALPANVAGSLVVNARMVGGIAHVRGHDLSDPATLDLISTLVLGGGGPQRLLGELGKRSGVKLASTVLRAVPVVGGLANGAADAGLTAALGRNAARAFPQRG
ncbi:hypothetical protein DT076_12150 [Desertihabitans brevis]|uniref:EcsC family protein n=1 Tax=Desertihabitans brevis TaxID=2268447 RepID=A0A367YT80_9ACTN|nr:hypothetical protein [Desertihabitans brevis]RCK69096.1 hypothetical protein DT076_12150 [Desertihabitans brevis]